MRIATYNVEWFDKLFGDDGALLEDGDWSARYNVTRAQQIEALGAVFKAVDADAFVLVEAPDEGRVRSCVAALETFAARFGLRQHKAIIGFGNTTQQEIALLYDPSNMSAHHAPRVGPDAPRFDEEIEIDLDVDGQPETVRWSKPPLELEIEAEGRSFRLIGVHAKSKAPRGATTPEEVMRISIANRRKQLAQCVWLRRRVAAHLEQGETLIVTGDFNDGPGLDAYEKLFGRSGVEIVLGEVSGTRLYDPHAAMALQSRFASHTTARFWLSQERRYLQALLDYVMVSEDVRRLEPRWRIWHPFDDPSCFNDTELREALLAASDHFPVSMDFDLARMP